MSLHHVSPSDFRDGDVIGKLDDKGRFKGSSVVQALNLAPDSSCNGVHVNENVKHSPSECYDRASSWWVKRA